MIVERYLEWADTAPQHMRAEAAGALARSYIFGELEPNIRDDVESVLTRALDDVSLSVRCAVAEALAGSPEAPHAIMLSLAQDAPDVAEPVLRRSPVLTDLELVDIVAIGGPRAHRAVAERYRLSAPVAAAVAEIAGPSVCLAMLQNQGARLTPSTLARIARRHGGDGAVRAALLARPDLGPELRQELMRAVADALSRFVTGRGWLGADRARRAADEACDRGAIQIAAEAADAERFVLHLASLGQFSPALALRAVLGGDVSLFEAALTALSGRPRDRVAGFMRDFSGRGFAAVYAEAGLPAAALPVFRAALAAGRETRVSDARGGGAGLSRRIVERALAACEGVERDVGPLRALLRRFAAEAARDDARRSHPSDDALARAA